MSIILNQLFKFWNWCVTPLLNKKDNNIWQYYKNKLWLLTSFQTLQDNDTT